MKRENITVDTIIPHMPKNKKKMPNKSKLDTDLNDIMDDIKLLREQLQELKNGGSVAIGKKGPKTQEMKELEIHIRDSNAVKRKLLNELSDYKQQLNKIKDEKRELDVNRPKQFKNNKNMPVDENDVNKRIKDIQFKMETSTLSLKEEKECIKQIHHLETLKPQVKQNNSAKGSIQELNKTLNTLRDKMNDIFQDKEKVQSELELYNSKLQELYDIRDKHQKEELSKKVILSNNKDEIKNRIDEL